MQKQALIWSDKWDNKYILKLKMGRSLLFIIIKIK